LQKNRNDVVIFATDKIMANTERLPKTKRSQAERVIAKFGGARQLAEALKAVSPEAYRNASSVYRWTYPRSKYGTAGVIPTAAIPHVIAAARVWGVVLIPEDFFPGEL
jgi:hypothetical protein